MKDRIEFWAKTTSDGKPGISVAGHMENVGRVAEQLAEHSAKVLERFHLCASDVAAFAALHDLGKISPGFQQKCRSWIETNGLSTVARNGAWDTAMESDHGKVSHAAIQPFLLSRGFSQGTAKYVSAVLGGHHGRLNQPNDRGFRPQGRTSEAQSGIDWDAARQKAADEVWALFASGAGSPEIDQTSPVLWWMAGLTSVADWIGSDERFFQPGPEKENVSRIECALKAIEAIGFRPIEVVKGRTFHELFHNAARPETIWLPNEMQEKTLSTVTGPGVYIIEAPMGTGKTEAALWAAYNLLARERASGIYFALPTQATSNRIHLRMNDFLSRICSESNKARLVHGNAWLLNQEMGIIPTATHHKRGEEDAQRARDWFASTKRALLAPFGVGTVDQALLGVVAARHFFVRHFALAGKVVIIDEVHSYDFYTGTIIDKLIATLEALGCTVIILSATLTTRRREQIVKSDIKGAHTERILPYPLVTGRCEGRTVLPAWTEPLASRDVQVTFAAPTNATAQASSIANAGGCVMWICNTVAEAQRQFQLFSEQSGKQFPLGLLHSRFPFWRRERIEDEWMERLGKAGATRCGCVLVSTQIVEQSVDLDADFMVSELAPTDMLLQRLGRLWRHDRPSRPYPLTTPRICIIEEEKPLSDFHTMSPLEILEVLGDKAFVYDPYVLLRTLTVWKRVEEGRMIQIPSEIRRLLEETYEDSSDDPVPWQKLFDQRFVRNSNERFKATMNSTYWQPELPDEEGVQTRLNDQPTVAVVLCRELTKKTAVFVDGTGATFEGEDFVLATAQAIHRNMVRVPKNRFEAVVQCQEFSRYLHGDQTVGILYPNGKIMTEGLKNGVALAYSDELGLIIAET